MYKIKLAIAVPTYNRLDKLKVLLSSIDNQLLCRNLELSLFISNIASNDGTSEFLEKETEKRSNLIIYNKPEDQTLKPNIFYLNKIISSDIEWVWFMGDDDKLSEKESLLTDSPFKLPGKSLNTPSNSVIAPISPPDKT